MQYIILIGISWYYLLKSIETTLTIQIPMLCSHHDYTYKLQLVNCILHFKCIPFTESYKSSTHKQHSKAFRATYLSVNTPSLPLSSWGSCYSIFRFICMFCRLLFVLLYFFFWPLCCLFFFDIRILITPLVIFKLFFLMLK